MIEHIRLTRKPKHIHGIDTSGIKFGVSWHVMEQVTCRNEIDIFKEKFIILKDLGWGRDTDRIRWECESVMTYYRKLWRQRYSLTFSDGMYIVSKKIGAYNWKSAGTIGGHNIWRSFTAPKKGNLLFWTRRDELDSNYFMINNDRGLEDGQEIMVERTSSLVDSIMRLDL